MARGGESGEYFNEDEYGECVHYFSYLSLFYSVLLILNIFQNEQEDTTLCPPLVCPDNDISSSVLSLHSTMMDASLDNVRMIPVTTDL